MGIFRRSKAPANQEISPRRLAPLHERLSADPDDQHAFEDMVEWGLIRGDFPQVFAKDDVYLAWTEAQTTSGVALRLYLTATALILDFGARGELPKRWSLKDVAYLGSQTVLDTQPSHLEVWEPRSQEFPTGRGIQLVLPMTQRGYDFNVTLLEHFRAVRPDLGHYSNEYTTGWGHLPTRD